MNRGTGVLPMMEDSPYNDFGSLRLVIVDDVLLHLDATAAREEIVPRSTSLWVLGEHLESLNQHGLIRCLLLGAPSAPRVQEDVKHVPIRFTGKANGEFTDRHRDLVRRPDGTVLQLFDRDLRSIQA